MINKKEFIKKITNIILNILICFFVVILFISIYSGFQVRILKNDYANFFGYSMFEVQTGSMKDEINPSDWIIIKLTKDVEINDVVTYKHDGNYITHRVIEAYQGTYVTKGDNNNTKDDPIDQSQIVGKVVKVLRGFGILRKTIFNLEVIIALIITTFLFNLAFKKDDETAKFEKKLKLLLNKVIHFVKQKLNKIELKIDKKEEKNYKKEEIKIVENKIEENKIKEENIEIKIDSKTEEEKEEELSKTSVYRFVKVNNTDVKDKFKQEAKQAAQELEEELSKTSMFRIIKADTSDIDRKVEKIVEKEPLKEKTNIYKVTVEAEKVVTKNVDTGKNEKGEPLDLENLKSKFDGVKSKSIIEKAIKVKQLELDSIISLLLAKEKKYVINSNLRDDFINTYIKAKYYSGDDSKSITKIKTNISDFSSSLSKKYIRDEQQQITINAYENALNLIAVLEQNRNNIADKTKIYSDSVKKYNDWEEEYIEYVVYNILEIQKKCVNTINESLKKLETTTFTVEFNKVGSKKDLSVADLKHNISFSKVYSDYIVDKTYKEGIVAEDKIAVLLTLLSGQLAKDIIAFNYNKKYMFYIPNSLFEKEKKIESLLKLLDNEYAKNHTYILIDIETIFKNKKLISKLKKSGYSFSILVNKKINIDEKNIGQLYLSEYFIIDKSNISELLEMIPNELLNKVIKDDINDLGDFGGE